MDDMSKQQTGRAAEPQRSGGERSWARPQNPDAYLETIRNVVDRFLTRFDTEYYVQACGCKSWFCESCCLSLGLKRREMLHKVLETFKSCQMWTLTIDPLLFTSPKEVFLHVRKRRAISELVRAIHKAGYLITRRFFYVIEWQKETEMPHWHLLLETQHIPFETVCEFWNRNRPKACGPVVGDRPGFGSVRFSAPKFTDAKHATNYATKYLIKHPDHGYPDWVLDMEGRIQRSRGSRGLWKELNQPTEEEEEKNPRFRPTDAQIAMLTHPPDCFCELCRGVVENLKTRNESQTIRERIKKCMQKCVIIKNDIKLNEKGLFSQASRCIGAAKDPYAEIRDKMNPDRHIDEKRIRIPKEEVSDLLVSAPVPARDPEWKLDTAFFDTI